MEAADAPRSVVRVVAKLPVPLELLVDERREVALDEGRHPGVADLEEHERPKEARQVHEEPLRVHDAELRIAPARVARRGVDLDACAGDDKHGREGLEGCAAFRRRLLPLALPVQNSRKGRRPGVHLQIEVFGEPLDEAEPLRQRRASLEPDFKALLVERPERVRHPVVLLDEPRSEAALPRSNAEEILELGVVVDERQTAARSARSMRASTAFVA